MNIRALIFVGLGAVAAGCIRVRTVPSSAGPVAVRRATDAGILPTGVLVRGKLNTTIGMSSSHARDVFGITLADAVTAGRATLVPSGAIAYGHVVTANPTGGTAGIQVAFDSLTFSGRSLVLDANITSVDAAGVSVRPVRSDNLAASTVASATSISFAGGAQLTSGATVTLVVVSPVRLTL
ncbi:MAG: hypothetical protein ABI442_07660 [Gemmatimonadaceae bacterium]